MRELRSYIHFLLHYDLDLVLFVFWRNWTADAAVHYF